MIIDNPPGIHPAARYGIQSRELDRMFAQWCLAHEHAMDIAAYDLEHPVWGEADNQWQEYKSHEQAWLEAYAADVEDTHAALLEAAGRV